MLAAPEDRMTTVTQTRQVVSAFHAARTASDFETAARHLAPTFRFQSPLMVIEDPFAYLRVQAGFAP